MRIANKANKPIVKKMKMEAKSARKALNAGIKQVKKSNKAANRLGK